MDEQQHDFDLPEHIIHRIQSFLTTKHAARTSLLSKSWRSGWSSRPTLDLDESNYLSRRSILSRRRHKVDDRLLDFARTTFRRYEDSNLRIDSFSLSLVSETYIVFGLASEWTSKALNLGATELTFRFQHRRSASASEISFPEMILSESLLKLTLQCPNIDRLNLIKCSRLESLTLNSMRASTNYIVTLLSSCPSIEYLSLSDINPHHLQGQGGGGGDSILLLLLRKLTSLALCRVDSQLQTFFLDDMSSKFPVLKTLTLQLRSVASFGAAMGPVSDEREILVVSSPSLETIDFKMDNLINQSNSENEVSKTLVNFDVPSLRKFEFEGSHMPELSFTSTTRGRWESKVTLTQHGPLGVGWFRKLSRFLGDLRLSRAVHLCLHANNRESFHYQPEEVEYCKKVREVESLTVDSRGLPSLSFTALLDGLLRVCRPRIVRQYVCPMEEGGNMNLAVGGGGVMIVPLHDDDDDWNVIDDDYDNWNAMHDDYGVNNNNNNYNYNYNYNYNNIVTSNDVFLCRAFERGMSLRGCLIMPCQYMYGLRHLEGIEAEVLCDGVWRNQPIDSLMVDDSESEGRRRFRLLLKWKPIDD